MHVIIDHNSTMPNGGDTTFTKALKDKYVNQEEFDNRLVLPKNRHISTEITVVGFDKVSSVQKQLYQLTSIDLSGREIAYAGCLEELRGSLNRVQLLNLANNLMSWQEVNSIISCLPSLRELILTNNPLKIESKIAFPKTRERNLSSLTLGRTCSDWNGHIRILSSIWNRVNQLDLWNSGLCPEKMVIELTKTSAAFVENIRVLRLSHNSFANIDWLANVGSLANLIELDLSNCLLQTFNLNEALERQLQNLNSLNISYNKLTEWKCISNLHTLRSLRNLICHKNPIFTGDKSIRSMTIGSLGQIVSLNREEITKVARRDAEIFYLRKVFPEYQSYKKGENDGFAINHPRYNDLADFYGLPEDLLEKRVFDKYVCVDLCYNGKINTKKLPFDMKIANLRMLCKRMFKIKPSAHIQITCHAEPTDSTLNYLLDQDGQTLNFFSVKSGQKLLIEESI